jgi:EpsI family protein
VRSGSIHLHWPPVALLLIGAFLTSDIRAQRSLELRAPLESAIPTHLAGSEGRDLLLSEQEAAVAGVSDYLLRAYAGEGTGSAGFSIYVGYYAAQTNGRTIHSPKNCLPGSGWEALASAAATVALASGGTATVNRYLLQNEGQRALVLYWYQGRGRVAHNEYVVKWDLLRDAALSRRSEEALVRIVVPVAESEEAAFELALSVATELIPAVASALPEADLSRAGQDVLGPVRS